jgi:hypothetical protein
MVDSLTTLLMEMVPDTTLSDEDIEKFLIWLEQLIKAYIVPGSPLDIALTELKIEQITPFMAQKLEADENGEFPACR